VRVGVPGVGHGLADPEDGVADGGGLGGHVGGREPALDAAVVVAVVRPPRRRGEPVDAAGLEDVGEAVVVGPDEQGDHLDPVGDGELLQGEGLALAVGPVVEVDAGLEVRAAAAVGGGAGARAGHVQAAGGADVDGRRLGAVAARYLLGGAPRVVPVGVGAAGVDLAGGLV